MQPWQRPEIVDYSRHLAESFHHWTGRDLGVDIYHAPFVLLSHGTQTDPIFRYANLAAQKLWNYSWEQFMTMPSRLSAEPDAREERERLLATAERQGYVDNYSGVRVTSDGKRFRIHDCILWNVVDDNGEKIGQAAAFNTWDWL